MDQVDSLRAFAMTAVIAEHCKIMPFGWMGVWLFFVISGFVVTTSLVSRPATSAKGLLSGFYARRAARILPIYLAYVLIGFLVSALGEGRFAWAQLASLILFFNNFQSAFAVGVFRHFPVGHLWTLSVEMQFYLVFGFAFAFLSRRTLVAGLIGLLFLAPLLRWAGGMWLDNAGFVPLRAAFAVYTFSPMHFDSFAFGCLLALAPSPWRKSRRSIALLLAGMAAMAVYAAFYVCVNHVHHAAGLKMLKNVISGILFGEGRQIWLYTTVAVLSAGVLATTLGGQAPWAIATRSPLVQAVGRASYGGYLYHAFCVTQARALLRATIHFGPGPIGKLEFGLGVFALALPATIAVSLFSYHYVERPVIAAANRRLARSAGS